MPTPTRSGRRPVQVPDRAAGARRVTLAALLAAALGTVVALTGLAASASAHGGDVVISLGTDGAGGISVNLTYKNDGHPVEESADVSVTAESDAGETVGPVALRSASEGVGWYVSDPGVLAEGHWLLTATMTEPAEATGSAEGIRCGSTRCIVRRDVRVEPRYAVPRRDPLVLECLHCGAPVRPKFAGSRQERLFHPLAAGSVRRVLPSNLVYFASRQEAEEAGFRAARRTPAPEDGA